MKPTITHTVRPAQRESDQQLLRNPEGHAKIEVLRGEMSADLRERAAKQEAPPSKQSK